MSMDFSALAHTLSDVNNCTITADELSALIYTIKKAYASEPIWTLAPEIYAAINSAYLFPEPSCRLRKCQMRRIYARRHAARKRLHKQRGMR